MPRFTAPGAPAGLPPNAIFVALHLGLSSLTGMNLRFLAKIIRLSLCLWGGSGMAIMAQTTNAPAVPVVAATGVENSVVKIFSTMRYPDPYKPWTKGSPSEATGTGVVIKGKRILTNAHVVNYASQIQVQANQAGDKTSRHRRIHRPRHRPRRAQARRRKLFRRPSRPGPEHQPARNQGPRHGLRLSRRRQQPVHHQGHRLPHRIRGLHIMPSAACASRSTPPSTPATAAVPPASVTR